MILRYNNVHSRLAATIDDNDTTITLDAALQEGGVNVPTLAGDTIILGIDDELVELTAYTAGATSGTVTRGYGDTLAVAHDAGAVVANVITKSDVGGGLSLGGRIIKTTDAASPLSLVDGVSTAIGETLMDDEQLGPLAAVAWSDTDDRYDVVESGVLVVSAEIGVDSSALVPGDGDFYASIACRVNAAASQNEEIRGPQIPYGSGFDLNYTLSGVRYFEAGGWFKIEALTRGTNVDLTYAELYVRQLPAG